MTIVEIMPELIRAFATNDLTLYLSVERHLRALPGVGNKTFAEIREQAAVEARKAVAMNTMNLTQHPATADQVEAGVFDLPQQERAALSALLTFDSPPSADEIIGRANAVAAVACAGGIPTSAMIGGALWLMAPLASALRAAGVEPVYAFSQRDVQEQPQPDGTVRKVMIFKHTGFVPAV